MVMGCNESREKERPPINFTFAVATPLPLHIYQEYAYPMKKSPTSSGSLSPTSLSPTSKASPTSLSPTSLSPTVKASPTSKASSTVKASPTSKASSTVKAMPTSLSPTVKAPPTIKSMATLHYNKLKAIAYYKFPAFDGFSRDVQEQIFGHIEKELNSMK